MSVYQVISLSNHNWLLHSLTGFQRSLVLQYPYFLTFASKIWIFSLRSFYLGIFYAQEHDETFKHCSSEVDVFKWRQIDFEIEK